ncbi:SDR family oxidoreductase [Candidatus Parabeggiatoa sp. HSG14]|uniref:NAD-dependent epimerase/dehydratase family protein n=1 Tax=Candidatus Parabeggiatoa sp. HSG14 TaxID=3055593 RepID=UPI0025A780C1|nr:SDR family oxidoreductase [Thiotrichales bacterium HSG14]
MKILLAGGAGYIGSLLIPKLLEHGYEVGVIDLLWFGNHLPKEVKVIEKDLFDCQQADFEGYDQVIFLAGLSNDPMAEFSPAMNFISNGAQPSYLAYIAKLAGVKRFIYGSSCSVYGYTVNELYDEGSPVTCGYPYGISKLQGERGVIQMQDDNFSVIALRQGTVCGYSPRIRFDLIVNTMYKSCMVNGKVTVNNASIWRPLLDIRDATNAYLRAIQADQSISGVFNVASDNYTVGQVGDMVKDQVEALTGQKIAIEIKNIQDFRNYKVTWKKAKTVLGYEPKYTVSDIIADVHKHRDEYGDFEDDSYYNIRTFKKLKV